MKSLKIILTVFFLVTFVAGNAFGSFISAAPGKTDPQRLRWKDKSIFIAISNSLLEPNSNIKADSDVSGAIERSVRAWQSVADIEFQVVLSDQQSVSPSEIGDGISLVTIAQTPENVLLFSKDPQAESAKTRVFYNRKNFITEADIVLSPFQQFSTDGSFGTFDLEATLTHEIGHLLGLRHSGVLGSMMSDSISKNGALGSVQVEARTLADNDIAAIRELYGVSGESEVCCAAITGKLMGGTVKSVRGLRVWAEDKRSGRVAAQTETSPDGSFRLGGLQAGSYSIFWQKEDDASPSTIGSMGSVNLSKDEVRVLNGRVSAVRSDIAISYAGINGQLADSAVRVEAGREYSFFLGGKNLDAEKMIIEFNSPFFAVSRGTISKSDFGKDVSAVSFVLAVHSDVPSGVYSIFATNRDGSMSSLIGALKVQ